MDKGKDKVRVGYAENDDSIDVGVVLHDEACKPSGTLLTGVSLDDKAAVVGCDSRSFLTVLGHPLDMDIVMTSVVEGDEQGPQCEQTYIKYNIEPLFALLHAGATDEHETVMDHLRGLASFFVDEGRPADVYMLASSLYSFLYRNPFNIPRVDEKEFLLVGVRTNAKNDRTLSLFRVDLHGGVVPVPFQSSVSVGVGTALADRHLAQIDYSPFSTPTDGVTRYFAIQSVSRTVYDTIHAVCRDDYRVGGDIAVIIFQLGRDGGLEHVLRRYPQRGYSFVYWEEKRLKEIIAMDMLKAARLAMAAEATKGRLQASRINAF